MWGSIRSYEEKKTRKLIWHNCFWLHLFKIQCEIAETGNIHLQFGAYNNRAPMLLLAGIIVKNHRRLAARARTNHTGTAGSCMEGTGSQRVGCLTLIRTTSKRMMTAYTKVPTMIGAPLAVIHLIAKGV